MRGLANDAETKLTAGERISLQNDIWASVRVGREPVGDYLAYAQGLQKDRNRAVLEDVLGRLNYIGQYLVNDSDRDAFRAWMRGYLTPVMKEVGWDSKPGETDEQRTLRSRVLNSLGADGRDPDALAIARKIADQALTDPSSVDRQLAGGAFALAAICSSCVDIRVLLLSVGDVSLAQLLDLLRRFPLCAAFPRAEYYQRIRLPRRHRRSYGWSIQFVYSTGHQPRPSWISQVP